MKLLNKNNQALLNRLADTEECGSDLECMKLGMSRVQERLGAFLEDEYGIDAHSNSIKNYTDYFHFGSMKSRFSSYAQGELKDKIYISPLSYLKLPDEPRALAMLYLQTTGLDKIISSKEKGLKTPFYSITDMIRLLRKDRGNDLLNECITKKLSPFSIANVFKKIGEVYMAEDLEKSANSKSLKISINNSSHNFLNARPCEHNRNILSPLSKAPHSLNDSTQNICSALKEQFGIEIDKTALMSGKFEDFFQEGNIRESFNKMSYAFIDRHSDKALNYTVTMLYFNIVGLDEVLFAVANNYNCFNLSNESIEVINLMREDRGKDILKACESENIKPEFFTEILYNIGNPFMAKDLENAVSQTHQDEQSFSATSSNTQYIEKI